MPELPAALNQGSKGACVSYAIAHARTLLNSESKTLADGRPNYNVYASGDYLHEKYKSFKNSCDSGAQFIEVLDALKTEGTTSFSDMGNVACGILPTNAQLNNAKKNRINDYYRLTSAEGKPSLDQIKEQISNGNPVIVSIAADRNFTSYSLKLWDTNNSGYYGGHAVVLTGYDNEKQAFRLLNSWGPNWGENGYIWATYEKIQQAMYNDVYVLQKDNLLTPTNEVGGTGVTFVKDFKIPSDNIVFYPTQQIFTNQMVAFMNNGELNWNNNVTKPLYEQYNNPSLYVTYWTPSNNGIDINGDFTIEVRVRIESSKTTTYPINKVKGIMLELWNGGHGGKSNTINYNIPIAGLDPWSYTSNELGETTKIGSKYLFSNYYGNIPLHQDQTIRFRIKDGQFFVDPDGSTIPRMPSGINRLRSFDIHLIGTIGTISDVRFYKNGKQIGIDTFDGSTPAIQWFE